MTMTPTTARAWQGPAIFSYGFRPFFLLGALQAALAVALWVPWFLGIFAVPSLLPPLAWHMHSLLFGFVPAIVAGFLLTAIPNWTGRRPIAGLPLIGLLLLWLAGRAAVILPAHLDPLVTALADLSFPVALTSVAAHEIIAARNWRNVKVVALLAVLLVAQAVFHWEIDRFGRAEISVRLAIGAFLTLIMLIGGRIVPSFTSNWLRRADPHWEPRLPNTLDAVAMSAGIAALAVWIASARLAVPEWSSGGLLVCAGLLHFARQARWSPHRTLSEPLVMILHVAYFFVPLGFVLLGLADLSGGRIAASAGIHAWTTGAIGTMTLAMMTRVSLGHTGRPLAASGGTVAIYIAIVIAAMLRIAAAIAPEWTLLLLPAAGAAWLAAYLGFVVIYGPMLAAPRADSASRA